MAKVGITRTFSVIRRNTDAATQRALVRVAKREHARVMATDPRPATFRRFVDGRQGAAEESVKPQGVILYQYLRLDAVAQYAMEVLFDRSPVLSGEYRKSHILLLNGSPVRNLRDWRSGDEVSISNLLPYARKIEVGKMKMRVSGTSQVYREAAKIVRRRYGNVASVTFTYRGLVGGVSVNPTKAAPIVKQRTIVRGEKGRFAKGTSTRVVSGGGHNQSNVRYPVLLITEL